MVESLGTIYIKKPYHVSVGADGVEEAIAGVVLPAYIIPKQYWLKTRMITSIGTPVIDAKAIQPYTISGRCGDFPMDFVTDANPPSAGLQLLTDLMEEFLPHEPGSVGDNNQDAQEDVGLPGSGVVGIRSQEFFDRDMWLGLPKNALIVDTDIIRYVDYFSTNGRIPNRLVGNYDQGTILAFGCTTAKFEIQAESDDSLFGGPANAAPQLPEILTEILDKVEANSAGDTPILFKTGMGDTSLFNSQALLWQTSAYGATVIGTETLDITSTLTLRCEIQIPQAAGRFVARAS